MANSKIHHDCSERVNSGGWHSRCCANPGTVECPVKRTVYPEPTDVYSEETFEFINVAPAPPHQVEEPKWFCGTHDPVAREAREQKKCDERSAMWKREQQHLADSRAASDRVADLRASVLRAAKALVDSDSREGESDDLVVVDRKLFANLASAVAARRSE